jgi:hypothetical protein
MRENKKNNILVLMINLLIEIVLLMAPFIHTLISENSGQVLTSYLCIPITLIILSNADGKGSLIINPFTSQNPRKAYVAV